MLMSMLRECGGDPEQGLHEKSDEGQYGWDDGLDSRKHPIILGPMMFHLQVGLISDAESRLTQC